MGFSVCVLFQRAPVLRVTAGLFPFILFLSFPFQQGCVSPQKKSAVSRLKFLNEQILEKDLLFQGLPVGGLSALAFDERTGEFLVLSDDKSRHRFYRFQLKRSPFQLVLKDQVFLRDRESPGLNRNMDPEGIGLQDGILFIASEGQQIFQTPDPPRIFAFSKQGVLKKPWPVPAVFWDAKNPTTFGTRENKGFEALTLTNGRLWTATEKPLRQDSSRLLRLSGFDPKTGKLLCQYPYLPEPRAGLSEIVGVTDDIFLTLERSYSKKTGVNEVRLFRTDCGSAENILNRRGIASITSAAPCRKSLLFDFSKLPRGRKVDNLEGMALGPQISADSRLIVFVSDDNFNPRLQKTQFLFFSLNNPLL